MKVICKIAKPGRTTWSVKGKNLEEVFKNLNAHRWWGQYKSGESIKWTLKDGKVDAVQVLVKPLISMPKWSGLSKATKEEKKSWDLMSKALLKHENEHHKVFLKVLEAWVKKLETLTALDKKALEKAWKAFGKEAQKQQDVFDKKTDHGAKKGVVLNIPAK